jgi:hypothetical protein
MKILIKGIMVLILALEFNILSLTYAEIIFTKDGQVIEAVITEKTDDTIWYEIKTGDMTEEIGIDISDVYDVLDDSGNISVYSPRKHE